MGENNSWLISVINGVRCEASQILYGQTDGEDMILATTTTTTITNFAREKDGYDYLELPLEFTEDSYPIWWRDDLPGAATDEIDELQREGVTRRVWGGTSGAGVWNLAIGRTQSGSPDGTVLVELAGICFYADQRKGCIIAHGTKSIGKIAARHIENEVLRLQRSSDHTQP